MKTDEFENDKIVLKNVYFNILFFRNKIPLTIIETWEDLNLNYPGIQ
jgi:hypothetical protein